MNDYIVKIKTEPLDNTNKFVESNLASFGVTNKICVIGVYNILEKQYKFFDNEDEASLLKDFWDYVSQGDVNRLIGWSSKFYDFPLIYQRTLINKITLSNFKFPLPIDLGTFKEKNYQNGILVDLSEYWRCGRFSTSDKLYNMGIAFNLFINDEEREFFLKEERNFKEFYKNWSASEKNGGVNFSKEFLILQLRLINSLKDYLL